VAVVVVFLEQPPHEREAVRVEAGGAKPDDAVAGPDARAVDELVAIDDADAGTCEVELAVAVDARELGRLAADERAARLAADLRRALDEFGHLLELDSRRGDVVEQEERACARRQHVVDAVRSEVAPTVAQPSALAREDQLRPDRVGRGGEEPAPVERIEPRERAEAARPGRLDRRPQALDDRLGRRERNAGGVVGAPHGPRVYDEGLPERSRSSTPARSRRDASSNPRRS